MTNGRNALELWAEAQYPFRWTALWPLIGAALAQGQIAGAIEYARALLDPVQQRLPNTLAEKVEEAIQEWEGGQPEICRTLLQQAIELAQRFNYL